MACVDCGVTDSAMYKCKTCGKPLCFTHFSLKSGICKSCREEVIALPSPIRRSHLDSYFKCPYQAYVYIMKQLKQEGNLWSNVGNILHDIFEQNSLSFGNSKEDELQKICYDKILTFIKENDAMVQHAQQLTKNDVIESMLERGRVCTQNYFKYEASAPKPMHTEYYIEMPISIDKDGNPCKPNISMTIDRINVLDDGEYEIVDYKTGKTSSGPALESGFQVPVYLLGFQHEFGILPKRFKLLYLEDDKERTFERIDDDKYQLIVKNNKYTISLKQSKRIIQDMLKDMSDGKWNVPTNLNGYYCNSFCGVYQAQLCAGKDLAKWNKGKLTITK